MGILPLISINYNPRTLYQDELMTIAQRHNRLEPIIGGQSVVSVNEISNSHEVEELNMAKSSHRAGLCTV